VIACPRQALSQSAETGVILIDDDKCDGCGWCIQACPFGTILLNSQSKVVEICDLCQDEDEPQCVKYCFKDALTLSTPQVVAQKARRGVVTRLLQELLGQESAIA
jgi:Fe-S-cluster-containing dehydrogenase component